MAALPWLHLSVSLAMTFIFLSSLVFIFPFLTPCCFIVFISGWWAVGAGLHLPGDLSYGQTFASLPTKGLEAWDAVPGWGKAQMLLFAGLIENARWSC